MHECTLPTKGRPPPLATFYHYPPKKAEEIDRQVEDYLTHDLIEECDTNTPFLSNCVLVKKKSGGHRLAQDFCPTNKILEAFIQPIPRLSCLIDCISEK